MKYLLNNYGKRFQLNFQSGKNSTLLEKSGKKFIDFASGIGVVSVGHGNQEIAEVIADQSKKILHVSNLYNIEPQEKLAEKISKLAGFELFAFFANSGAEANEAAIKLARKFGAGKRYKIYSLLNSFHGRTLGSLSATGQKKLQEKFLPMVDGFEFFKSVQDIENQIVTSSENDLPVAVILELVQGEGGIQALPKKDVQNLAKTLKSKNILLIIDEVQTGIYRTGEFLTSQIYEIEPDIITLAKGLGGGIPIGAMVTKLKDGFEAGDHGSTFGGNYLSTSVALKVLEILENEYSNGKLALKIEYFKSKLKTLQKKFPDIILEITGLGLMIGLKINSKFELGKIIELGHKHEILTLKSGNNILRFLPPLTISENEINQGFSRLEKVFQELNN